MLAKVPTFEVTNFSDDFLNTVVSFVTDTPLSTKEFPKDHVIYLSAYLKKIGTKTVVLEGSYIDQNYLEDYQLYYSSCFPNHPKCCTRLHFFSNPFDEPQLLELVNNFSSSDNEIKLDEEKLSENYLGYIIIRPIPETFIARLCLKQYDGMDAQHYRLTKKKNLVNLFGLQLSVHSAPFTEKDKVVSACATSSIWMLLCSSSHYDRNTYPSPGAITKFALARGNVDQKGFPTLGLDPQQVCSTIQNYGLEASEIFLPTDPTEFFPTLKSYAVAYVTNQVPFILAGKVYEVIKDKSGNITTEVRHLGEHAICVLGYKYKNPISDCKGNKSEYLEKLYVHDDRYGPYLSLQFSNSIFTLNQSYEDENENEEGDMNEKESEENQKKAELEPITIQGLEISLDKNGDGNCKLHEIFVPDRIILAKHHKARIAYPDIQGLTKTFLYICLLVRILKLGDEKDFIEPSLLSYEIKLSNSNELKKQYRESRVKESSFNGIEDKSSFLCKSLPKHIWVTSIYSNKELLGDILFDATEVIQGRPLIGYITYTESFNKLWQILAKEEVYKALTEMILKVDSDPESKSTFDYFKAYLKLLMGSDNLYMNIIYGEPKISHRAFKGIERSLTDEKTRVPGIFLKPNVKIIKFRSSWSAKELDKKNKYIWLIDLDGDMYYGKEDINDKEYCTGHPTLNSGRTSRLAGELYFNDGWKINLKSGAYSIHVPHKDHKKRLTTVITHNFIGWKIPPQIDNLESNMPSTNL